MANRKNRIVLKDTKKFTSAIIKLLIVVILIIACVTIVKNFSSDSVKKQIEKQEGQKIDIKYQQIVAYIGENKLNSTEVKTKDIISFKVEYTYQLTEGTNKAVKYYTTSDGIDIKISDSALAGLTSDKTSVQIQEGVTEDKQITFTITYDKNKDLKKDFTYTIKSDAVKPDDTTDNE